MASKITKPVSRTVVDLNGKSLIVTLTADGILFRRPRSRDSYLLPYSAGETRAQVLAAGVGFATAKTRRGRGGTTHVSRGLLTRATEHP